MGKRCIHGLALSAVSLSAAGVTMDAGAAESTMRERELLPRFSLYNPSYLGVANQGGDNSHSEFFYSFRYRLTDQRAFGLGQDNYLFFAYTGAFDFYWTPTRGDTRDSGPVINRLNNPEIHYRFYLNKGELAEKLREEASSQAFVYIDAAVGHESNGQTISNQQALDAAGPHGIDLVSRSWNYISLETKYKFKGQQCSELLGCNGLDATLRWFFTQGREDTIFWDPQNHATITQYDGLRAQFMQEWNPDGDGTPRQALWATYRTGISKPFARNSITANGHLQLSLWGLKPLLFVRYFYGYGRTISDYTRHDSYWLVGFRFR